MSNTDVNRSKRGRVVAVIACLAVAFAAALITRRADHRETAVQAVAIAQPPQGKTPADIFALIPELKGDSSADQAIAKARTRAAEKPDQAAVWIDLADSLMQKARDTTDERFYDPAELAYARALHLDEANATAMSGMAWVKGDRHLFDESMQWAKKAVAREPGNAPAFGIMGDAALELGDYDAAFEHYQKMMDLRPDLASYSRGAYLLWVTGNRPKAAALMEKAIRAGGPYAENTAWCRARLALMLFQQGAYPPAEQALVPALENSPRNVHVLLAAGRIKTAQQDFPAAKEFYLRVLELVPNHEALVSLGDLAAAAGDMDGAEKYYQQVEELHLAHRAKGAHDHMQMARFYADAERNLTEALRIAEQRKLTRNVFEADTLAWVYLKNGQVEKAQEAITRALAQNTPDPAIQYHAGMIAARAGDRVSAKHYLSTALTWSPYFELRGSAIAVRALEELGDQTAKIAGSVED